MRGGIFDGLGLVEDHCSPRDRAKGLLVGAELRVVDDEQIHRPVEAGFSSRSAVPDIHFEFWKKFAALVGPVVLNGFGTDHEDGG